MIIVIRITGEVGLRKEINETFNRLRLRKKYSCIVFENPTKEQLGMVNKVRDFVAFGEINPDTYKKLVEKRKTKIDNFFRLHSPRGGIKTKLHFPKGVLGDHKEKINKLVERML
ncbi:uL30 family ribosomal protein [Candidatus Pacearchaeota archaeon]|nr:uL30 family ribosomal protein [Candidatus Pacearchaeota archaeon]